MNVRDALDMMMLLLGEAVHSQLTPDQINLCLELSTAGGDYDPWLAAAEAADMLGRRAQQGGLKQFSADGATFVKEPADWFAMASGFRARSPRYLDPGFACEII